jgi:hypothetical protein
MCIFQCTPKGENAFSSAHIPGIYITTTYVHWEMHAPHQRNGQVSLHHSQSQSIFTTLEDQYQLRIITSVISKLCIIVRMVQVAFKSLEVNSKWLQIWQDNQ